MSGSLLGLFPRRGGRRRRAIPPGGGGPAEGLPSVPELRRHRGVFLPIRGARHRRRCPRRAPVPAVGSDTEKSSSAAHPGRVRWLLPGLGPVSPMCCSVLCLVTCLALFSSASLTQLFTGTSFLPFFFFFFLNLFRFFGELARAFHIWSSNVLSSALWLRLPLSARHRGSFPAKRAHQAGTNTAAEQSHLS